MSDFAAQLAGLNPAQRAAVLHAGGPLLVLAGAGSGKTRVVTFRIAHLVRQGVPASHILALTFTNKAAAEMRERCTALLPFGQGDGLLVSTFHSLGARFLRQYAARLGRTPSFTLYDDDDQVALLKRVLEEAGLGQRAGAAREVRDAIDRAKNAGRPVAPEDMPPELLAAGGESLPERYEVMLRRANAFDFGDLIIRPAELLEADPALAELCRARWPHVLVDELQDTNAAQFRWLRALAPPESTPSLCGVGDDDQAIYAWRGAEIQNILAFPNMYPGTQVVRLEQNYRSTGHILGAANGVIAHNRHRLGKTLFTVDGDGERLAIRSFPNPREEARWVAQRIRLLCRDEGHTPGDFAILLRTNALSLDVEEALRASRLPYATLRGRSFYERAEIRDALSWLRLAVNPDDDVALRRAAGAPPRGIGETTLDKLAAVAAKRGTSLVRVVDQPPAGLRAPALAALAEFRGLVVAAGLALAQGNAPEQVAHTLLQPLMERFRADGSRNEDAAARLENVERLLLALQAWRQENRAGMLGDWLETVRLVSDTDDFDPSRGGVSLLTVHAAKGLEFSACFVMGLEDGVFPHRRGEDDPAWEEDERRLCYVAMTRARRHLALTWCKERRTFAEVRRSPPSRFLAEIPSDHVEQHVDHVPASVSTFRPRVRLPAPVRDDAPPPDDSLYADATFDDFDGGGGASFRKGMSVWHADLGKGVVVGVSGGRSPTVTVEFPDVGRRTIVGKFLSPYDDSGGAWDT